MRYYEDTGKAGRQARWNERGTPGDNYKPERPVGVTILAVLNFIGVTLVTLNLLAAILAPRAVPPASLSSSGAGQSISGIVQDALDRDAAANNFGAVLEALVGIPIGLVVGIGLWRLRSWGRKVALFHYGGGAILLLLLSYSRPLTGAILTQVIISGAAFIYLLRPEVRAVFYHPMEG